MDTNKMREQFEAWADSEGYVLDCVWGGDGNHGYENEETQHAWGLFKFSWQASRDAVAVELPKPHYEFEGDEAPEMFASQVVAAIEAQGLKVTP